MSLKDNRTNLIRTASFIALFGNAALAALKIIVGLTSNSLAVVGDGIDSSTDVVISAMTLIVASVIARPADEEHPWGHGRAETIATSVLSFILFFAGGQLVLNAVTSLFSQKTAIIPGFAALAATFISILGKLLLAWSQFAIGKKADSQMLIANAKNMRGDVVISSGVLIGLGLSIGLSLPLADKIVALLVGVWVLKSAIDIFMETNLELMDGSADRELYQTLFDAVRSVPGAGNPHRARMRRIASAWDIDLDIEVDPDLSVREAHEIAAAVENAIKKKVDGVFDIMVHVEPAGIVDEQGEEGFGLREKIE
ncbi:MAG: cation diffusion facilitator family transporter [Treponemataceae bacterium]